jgi:hypothetical protein
VPGVGAVVALTFVAAVDDPARFRRSKDVGAHFCNRADRVKSLPPLPRHGARASVRGRHWGRHMMRS